KYDNQKRKRRKTIDNKRGDYKFWRKRNRLSKTREAMGDCPECPDVLQTIEKFGIQCKKSKEIRKFTYGFLKESNELPPRLIKEIFTVSNIQ
ncbi:21957_t:CDS:2, partial [Gigaspora rosea]